MKLIEVMQVTVDGVEKLTPCSPGDAGATEMSWTDIEAEKLQEPPLRFKDLVKAISNTKPTVSKVDLAKHAEWTNEFGNEGS